MYRTYNQKVFRTCLRFAAGDGQWALDRTQDAFVKLVDAIATVRDRQEPGGWLYCVAVHNQQSPRLYVPVLRSGPLP